MVVTEENLATFSEREKKDKINKRRLFIKACQKQFYAFGRVLLGKKHRDIPIKLAISYKSYTDHKMIQASVSPEEAVCFNNSEVVMALKVKLSHETQHIHSTVSDAFKGCIEDIIQYWDNEAKNKKLYLDKGKAMEIAHFIVNGIEDGRIEKILFHRKPQLKDYFCWYRGNEWLSCPITDKKQPDLIVAVNQCHKIATMGMYQKGFEDIYKKGNSIYDKIQTLKPLVEAAVNQKTCRLCMEYCFIIAKQLTEEVLDILTMSEEDKEVEDMLNEIFEQEKDKSRSYMASESDEETNDNPDRGLFGGISSDEQSDEDDEGESGSEQSDGNSDSDDESKNGSSRSDENDSDEDDEGKSGSKQSDDNSDSDDESKNGSSRSDENDSDEDDEGESGSKQSDSDQSDDNSDCDGESKEGSGLSDEIDSDEDDEGKSNSEQSDDNSDSDDKSKEGSRSRSDENNSDGENEDRNDSEQSQSEKIEKIMEKIKESGEKAQADVQNIVKAATNENQGAENDTSEHVTKADIVEIMDNYKSSFVSDFIEYPESECDRVNSTSEDVAIIKKYGNMLKRVVDIQMKNKQTYDQRFLRSGKLDIRNIHKLPIGSSEVFMKKGQPSKWDGCAYILKDGSGSMSGSKNLEACKALAIIEHGIKETMPFKITEFATSGDTVTHRVIKNWKSNDVSKNYSWNFYNKFSPTGGNKDGYSIRVATKELLRRGESQKLMIIISDGLPSAYESHTEGYSDVHSAVMEARKKGIFVISIYIGEAEYIESNKTNYEKMYEKDFIGATPENLPKELSKIFKRFIKAY